MDLPPINKIQSKLGFIGDGNMAKAICKGLVKKGACQSNTCATI